MSSKALAPSCSLLLVLTACQPDQPPAIPSAPDPAAQSAAAPASPAPAASSDPAEPDSTDPAAAPASDPEGAEAANDSPGEEATPATPQTLFVRDRRAECQGEAPMKCLQVRNSANEPWRNLYTGIEGFRYEEGNAYELRVEVASLPYPALDASSLRYRLLEVVSKQPVEKDSTGSDAVESSP